MPKLWSETIDAHRRTVRETIMKATWSLVSENGLMSVTMSQIAQAAGVGRATLYKYFPDVEAILHARHEQHIAEHLEQLTAVSERPGSPAERLRAVLETYATICHHRGRHGTEELSALLHRPENVGPAERRLAELFQGLLEECAAAGEIRDDARPDELASYCLHALTAAGTLPSEAAARRLAAVTLTGLGTGRPTGR